GSRSVQADEAVALAGLDGLPGRDRQLADAAAAMRVPLVLHLHRLDDADPLPGLPLVALGALHRQHRSLHRADDGVFAGTPAGPRTLALAPAAGELGPRRLRAGPAHPEPPARDPDKPNRWGQAPAGRRVRPPRPLLELPPP